MEKKPLKESILERWKSNKKQVKQKSLPPKVPEGATVPLSHGQERIWFLQQLYPDNPFYNYVESYNFKGAINQDLLEKVFRIAFQSHKILRSYYPLESEKPKLKISEQVQLPIQRYDFRNLDPSEQKKKTEQVISSESMRIFDLSKPPLISISFIQVSNDSLKVVLSMHHIITDEWSMELLRKDVAQLYQKAISGQDLSPVIQEYDYSDFAYNQRLDQENKVQLDYWKAKLEGELPKLELPYRNARKSEQNFTGSYITEKYSPELSKNIEDLSKRLGKTPFTVLLSAFYILLHKYSGQNDILIGSPVSIRTSKALEGLIGFLNDTLVLRNKIDIDISFAEFAQNVKEAVLDAFTNAKVSFDTLVKELQPERSVSSNPFFNTMFVYNAPVEPISFGERIEFSSEAIFTNTAKFDLTLFVHEKSGVLSSTFEYKLDVFDERTIQFFQVHLKNILEIVTTNQNTKVSDINMLIEDESQNLISHNPIQENYFDGFTGIHEIIYSNAKANPKNKALVFGELSLTYGELEGKSELLAEAIVSETKGKNIIIGLSIPQSLEMIVGMLGILKSGAAYLPIDPDYPQERIQFMLEDSEVDILVTTTELKQKFSNFKGEIIDVNDSTIHDNKTQKISLPKVNSNDIAYVIYTSGSSGKPKGVPINHKNIIGSTAGRLDFYPENPSAFLLMSSISFDSSKAGIFWTLCTGGTLVIAQKRLEQDTEAIGEVIEKNSVSHTLMLPSLYQTILENTHVAKLLSLKAVIVAGEASLPAVVQKHFEKLSETCLYNEYGPTEATVWCTAQEFTKERNDSISIGKAVADAKIALLDPNQKQVPYGAIGEIYIAGNGLTSGYIKREDLNEKAFLELEFLGEKQRWYRTGDLGRFNSDGGIEFLGRADEQIKIRGYRVELGDIEQILLDFKMIEEVIVLPELSDKQKRVKRLIGFLKSNDKENIDIQSIKLDLKQQLPDYMVPSDFVLVDEIPHLPNRKVDKKELLKKYEPTKGSKTKSTIALPTNQTEEKLVSIWKNVLSLDSIGVTDNFFELGGDSILSIQVISQARKKRLSLSPNLLFKYQTIQELALAMPKDSTDQKPTVMASGKTPMLPIQKWFFEEHKNAAHYWNQGVRLRNLSITKIEAVQDVVHAILKTQDALRLAFRRDGEKIEARFMPLEELQAFEIITLQTTDASDKEKVVAEELVRIQQNIDLAKGSLFKCLVLNEKEKGINECILLAHHLVIDAVSWSLLIQNFIEGIQQCQKGLPVDLPKRLSSIKEWGAYLIGLSKTENVLNEVVFWKNQSLTSPLNFPNSKKSLPPYLEKDIDTVKLDFDTDFTQNLLTNALESYGTKVDELFITALVIALQDWCKTDTIPLFLERHGRETQHSSLDLSNTIGWFTSFFPFTFSNIGQDYEKTVIAVKEQLREIPNGGIGYGILKYINKDLREVQKPQVVFNYLGKQEYSNDVEFLLSGMRSPESERNYAIEINAYILNDKVQVTMNFASTVFDKNTIVDFADRYRKQFEGLINFCIEKDGKTYTPSDFTEVDLDSEDLENLLGDLEL